MNLQEAINPSIDDAIKYYRSVIFPQDMSAHTLRAVAINDLTIKALLEKAARAEPENKPLTLDELRKMCKPNIAQLQQMEPYAPVWIVTPGNKKISCQITRGLIKTDNRCKPPKEYIDAHMVGLLLSDYGKTWIAYARKPEEFESNE